ncbi:MAG: NADH:flavin oxidoreductase [Steroidobacteraceae bacterium]
MTSLFAPLEFTHGPAMKNRFVLAPLTNLQSLPDGRLGEDEYRWLQLRAQGGFGLTMTCASHVQAAGQGFRGQLGCWSDEHLPGLTRLATALRVAGTVGVLQLHHAGLRAAKDLTGMSPVAPSSDAASGARGLALPDVDRLREDFIAAALRAERAGFAGVELHGAHGYVLCQFLSGETNRRDDRYGGPLENRLRLVEEIIAGIRARCGAGFGLGLRLSPERYGLRTAEMLEVAARLMQGGALDYLDLSLWDVFKEPEENEYRGRTLLDHFAALDRGRTRIGAAGKIRSGADARRCLEAGADFVIVGRAAILHHDFPRRIETDPDFAMRALPVGADELRREGVGEAFLAYLRTWKDFVAADA